MEKNTLESTNKLLRAIIALLLRQGKDEVVSQREQIKILDSLGMSPTEISEILGRSSKFITKELAVIRRTGRKIKHGKEQTK